MLKSINLIKELLFDINGELTNILKEPQNMEYEGTTFNINENKYRSRLAKRIPKKEREKLDRAWLSILAEVKRLMRENVPPHAQEAQQVFLNINDLFIKIVPEDVIVENIDKWEEQLESAEADDFVAPTFWSKEQEAYMEEIAKAMEQQYKENGEK